MICVRYLIMKTTRIGLLFGSLLMMAGIGLRTHANEKPAAVNPEGLELYRKSIKPLFQKHCVDCHGGAKTKGGLDLTRRINLMQGGDSGAVVLAGNHEASLLFKPHHHDSGFTVLFHIGK